MADLLQRAVTVSGVPARLHFRGSPERAAGRGTVLFYHGFGGAKDRVEGYARLLAGAGFLAVCPDAVGHGERRYRDFDQVFNDARWDADFDATESDFLRLIDASAAEVPDILDELIRRGWARAGQLGIGGRSLGGNIAYAAVLADPRLHAMTSVVGSPEWTLPREHSPHLHPERFFPAAVHSQSAGLDEFVPAGPVREFHRALTPFYASDQERSEYVEFAGTGHFLTPELNLDSQQRVVRWFERWLPVRSGAGRG